MDDKTDEGLCIWAEQVAQSRDWQTYEYIQEEMQRRIDEDIWTDPEIDWDAVEEHWWND